MMQKKSAPAKTVRLILIVWLLLAFVVGGTGWLRPAPAPAYRGDSSRVDGVRACGMPKDRRNFAMARSR